MNAANQNATSTTSNGSVTSSSRIPIRDVELDFSQEIDEDDLLEQQKEPYGVLPYIDDEEEETEDPEDTEINVRPITSPNSQAMTTTTDTAVEPGPTTQEANVQPGIQEPTVLPSNESLAVATPVDSSYLDLPHADEFDLEGQEKKRKKNQQNNFFVTV